MTFLTFIGRLLLSLAISYAMYLLNRPKTPDAPDPETAEDLPRAEEGLGMQMVWGTGVVTLDVVDHFDYATEPIKA